LHAPGTIEDECNMNSGSPGHALPVAVAGGGIGGLAAALALARRGFPAVVLEKADAFGEAGVGLQVAPNALNVLQGLGVGAAAQRDALLIERMLLMDGVSGETVVDIPCGPRFRKRYGSPYAVAHRADIHGALLEGCRANKLVELRTGAEVTGYGQASHGVTVRLATGESLPAAALVGADGIHSKVREQVVGDGAPLASGAVIYRAVIPAADMPREHRHPYPTLWAGPDTHIIYYPLRDWSMFNFGATIVTGQQDMDETSDVPPEQVLPLFAANCEAPMQVMRAATSFRRWVIRHRAPVERWTDGATTLLGDAAHAMVQYIAQGAAQALEDAACLGWCARRAGGDFAQAFIDYERLRIPRTARVQIASLQMHHLLHAAGAARLARNNVFEGRNEAKNLAALDWLYMPQPWMES
jgi:2-polyprenyl-6-methoxyphenol hydroxylase-like FAD-dependent oxidoreductase